MSLIRITNDVFDIANRVRAIDSGYFIVYNTDFDRYEVHNSKQKPSTFCIVCDKGLNATVVQKLHKSKIENLDKLLKEIEKNNEIMEKEQDKAVKDVQQVKLKEMYNYAKSKTEDVDFKNSYQTNWV